MGKIKKFYTRAELGMRRPNSVSSNITPQNGGVSVHYGGGPQRVTSEAEARRRWLAWQTQHMNRGWADIAYTAGYDNWGNVYPGRGLNTRTAANGTNSGNQNFYAFVWIGGGDEEPTKEAYDALNWLIDNARSKGRAGLAVKPHGFFKATACPGAHLRRRAAELDGKSNLPSPSGGGAPAPSTPPRTERSYITTGDKGAKVREWQEILQRWDPSALPRFGVDGDFGGETAEWTIRLYADAGLRAADPARPRVGSNSFAAGKRLADEAEAARNRPRPSRDYITVGDKGSAVREWQSLLRRWNPNALPRFGVDGDFGEETRVWTMRFYSSVGISVSDSSRPRVGPRSLSAMSKALERPKFSATCTRQTLSRSRSSRGECVSALQRELNRRGHGAGSVDGIFGPMTDAAVRRFQTSARITVDGIVGPQTWRALQ